MSLRVWRVYGNHAEVTARTDECGRSKLCPCLLRDIEQLTAIAEAADRAVGEHRRTGSVDLAALGQALDRLGERD